MPGLDPQAAEALAAHRARIDAIDGGIVDLLNARQREALAIRAIKEPAGFARFDAEREEAILARVAAQCERDPEAPLSGAAVREIYAAVLKTSKELQP